jgi:hypothetical protein
VDWGAQFLDPNIGEDARAKDDVKEFKYSQLEFVFCIFYHFIKDTINTTGLFGLEGLSLALFNASLSLYSSLSLFISLSLHLSPSSSLSLLSYLMIMYIIHKGWLVHGNQVIC